MFHKNTLYHCISPSDIQTFHQPCCEHMLERVDDSKILYTSVLLNIRPLPKASEVIYGWSLYLYDPTPFSMIGQQVSTSSTVFLTFSICLRNLKYANLNILTVVRQQQISFALLQSKSAALVVTPSILLNTLKHFIDNIFVLRY